MDKVGYLPDEEDTVSSEVLEQDYEYSTSGYFNSMFDPDGEDTEERPEMDEDLIDLVIESLEVQIKWLKRIKQNRNNPKLS